ncbi:transcriptional regulator [Streptomyces sp. NBC_00102]|uniref:transcriptional regulator n=1 Tax=Streptomyces sp. NBC_00102 TaxID=2975652 RepID=UPI0022514895|nr:transcriptional regulator [Streptomyces sp. NBC_00102]MCX5397185.1 transcriptional regulator [Streptomyces sp. NBC_00102]
MLAMSSETLACPDMGCQYRLAAQLPDLIPGVATTRVGPDDPIQARPYPDAIVKDEAGETVELDRTTHRVAARWILRAASELDRTRPQTFDPASAPLTRSDLVASGWGR